MEEGSEVPNETIKRDILKGSEESWRLEVVEVGLSKEYKILSHRGKRFIIFSVI